MKFKYHPFKIIIISTKTNLISLLINKLSTNWGPKWKNYLNKLKSKSEKNKSKQGYLKYFIDLNYLVEVKD